MCYKLHRENHLHIIYFRLIVPGLGSDRIYIVDVVSDSRNPKLDKVHFYFSS